MELGGAGAGGDSSDVVDVGEADARRALAIRAACWWGDILRERAAPSLLRDAGYGDAREPGTVLRGVVGDLFIRKNRVDQPPPSEEQIVAFEQALAEDLVQRGMRCGSSDVTLCVDYAPEGALAEAIRSAGIVRCDLPFKTTMWIEEGEIAVSRGYRMPRLRLCETKHRALLRRLYERHGETYPGDDVPFEDPVKRRWYDVKGRLYEAWKALPEAFEQALESVVVAMLAEATADAARAGSG
jgi:hypothetical protein